MKKIFSAIWKWLTFPIRRFHNWIHSIPHLFAKSTVIYCITFASTTSAYCLYKQGQGIPMTDILLAILGFFGGELLLLCLKTILKKNTEEDDDEDSSDEQDV